MTAQNCSQPLPTFYYLTDHYVGYSAVLVHLSRVTPDVLRDLLGMAHKFVTAHEARPTQKQAKAEYARLQ
jgi:hypothetical protein